eukprot:Tamp_29295.p1 GENE.Tamp_29295~~Tamp_29295.p1  ORF type:complete len:253 (+),score=42.71 Tamp_29295:41-760(+)
MNPRESLDSPLGSPLGHHRPAHHVMTVNEMCASPQGPPLDYSFLEIRTIEELREVMPRSGYRKQPPEFLEDEMGQQIPNPAREEWVPAPNPNMRTEALKMGNNMLTALPPAFNIIIREIIDTPRNLSWIDLSFNLLEEIPSVLSSYTNLNVIYLHANRIRKVTPGQCVGLVDLPKLRSLTLHGNPCEQQTKNYRLLVTGMFRQIKTLDFTTITSIDREKADGFYARYQRIKENSKSNRD